MKIGDKVVYKKKMKMLDEGSVGIIHTLNNNWCSIIYPQNSAYEDDGKGGWKLRKNAPNKIYAHSAYLDDIEEIFS